VSLCVVLLMCIGKLARSGDTDTQRVRDRL